MAEPEVTSASGSREIRGIPRSAVACAAFALLAVGFMAASETPTGRLEGVTLAAESGAPLANAAVVVVPLATDGGLDVTRRLRSDARGRFSLARVTSGSYFVSASTPAHAAAEQYITVDEGGVASARIALRRSHPDFTVDEHVRHFAAGEPVSIPIKGYVPVAPAPAGAVAITLRRATPTRVLQTPRADAALSSLGPTSYRSADGQRIPSLLASLSEPPRRLDVKVTEADIEGYFVQRAHLGDFEPGLYLAEMDYGAARAATWFHVARTALVTKASPGSVTAWVVDIRSGVPVRGYNVTAHRGAARLAQAVTNREGLARLALPAGRADSGTVVVAARRGDDEAVVSGSGAYMAEGTGRYRVLLYTDRPIYRPGHSVHFKGIVRETASGGAPYRVPADQPVTVALRSAEDEPIGDVATACNGAGSFSGTFEISPEAATGVHTLVALVGGERHTADVVVASYRKPEFTVRVTPARARVVSGGTAAFEVQAQYYFGAPLAGARVRWNAYRELDWSADVVDPTEWDDDDRPNHVEDASGYYGEGVGEGAVTLDGAGKAVIELPAAIPDSPEAGQAYNLTLTATVTDASEREADATGVVQVTASDVRVALAPSGYLTQVGQDLPVAVRATTFDGVPIAGQRVDLTTEYEWGAGQEEAEGAPPPAPRAGPSVSGVTGQDGVAQLRVRLPEAGEVRLVALARDARGRASRTRDYLWVSAAGAGELQGEYATLAVATDRRRYAPGQTARVLVTSSGTGQTVLLAVESDRVHRTWTVPMKTRTEEVSVPVLAAYGPNVHLTACQVRQKRFTSASTSLRVQNPEREVRIAIEPDRVADPRHAAPQYQPGDAVAMRVRTTDSRGTPVAAEVSVAVVDEAVYALREDDPSAFRDAFYPQRYLRVSTSSSIDQYLLAGGDKAEPNIELRRRFTDTALWSPHVRTDADGLARVSFQMPDNLTAWRVTCLAHTRETAWGRATARLLSARDFMVRLETPRFLTQGDETRVLALVHNQTADQQTALVRLRAQGVSIRGKPEQSVQVGAGRIEQISWPVTAGAPGEAVLAVTAWTPRTAGGTQLTDGVEQKTRITPRGRLLVQGLTGEVTPGAPAVEPLRIDPAADPAAARVTVRLSPSALSATVGALDYLVGFPYGCTEQTLSRFIPTLLVGRLGGGAGAGMLSSKTASQQPTMVRDGLMRVYRLQKDSGGWGWWEHDAEDPWMTAYAVYGLAVARAEGVAVSQSAMDAARGAVRRLGAGATHHRPFLLYAAALAGDRDWALGGLRRVPLADLSDSGLAYVALTGQVVGVPQAAALQRLAGRAMRLDGMVHWQGSAGDGSTDVGATAVALRALLGSAPDDVRVRQTVRWLMLQRAADHWVSTRDTALVLAAIADYTQSADARVPAGQVALRLNGRVVQSWDLTPASIREPELVWRSTAGDLRPGRNDLQLEWAGSGAPAPYSVELRQVLASEDAPAHTGSGLGIKREYLRVETQRGGVTGWSVRAVPAGGRFAPGDRVRVRLTLTAQRDMAYALLEDPFPAGLEPTERGSAEVDDWSYWWSATDVRDDRIAFFARVLPRGRHVIEYHLRAQTPGVYNAMPAVLSGMYAPAARAESAVSRVEVRP